MLFQETPIYPSGYAIAVCNAIALKDKCFSNNERNSVESGIFNSDPLKKKIGFFQGGYRSVGLFCIKVLQKFSKTQKIRGVTDGGSEMNTPDPTGPLLKVHVTTFERFFTTVGLLLVDPKWAYNSLGLS